MNGGSRDPSKVDVGISSGKSRKLTLGSEKQRNNVTKDPQEGLCAWGEAR